LNAAEALLLVEFHLQPYWIADAEPVPLTALYCISDGTLQVTVTDATLTADGSPPAQQYARWLAQHKLVSVIPGEPLPLLPVSIPKPWGQEIWYTGVEERGVCHFGSSAGSVPIPWLQAVMPNGAAGPVGMPLVLLKILDPAPQEVTGDLYFELHEEKREVYVVTHVDRDAWPDGCGAIRYGFNPARLADSGSERQFRVQYLAAVRDYEAVRRTLDTLPAGAEAPPEMLARERDLRNVMNSFTHLQPLQVGDVVVVPLLLPHSLQHGVRTIEFQTPVYERKILSFAQQVLTQDHWDTAEAVSQMRLTPPPERPFECLERERHVLVERIVDFPDFEVRRVNLQEGGSWVLAPLARYGVVMVVAGELDLDGGHFGAEQALFLPAGWGGEIKTAQPAQPLVLLLALPRG
jgi:hypothetical protein